MNVNVTFTAIPDETFKSVITEVAPALDRDTSTYPVTVMVTDADERIKSGMAANVLFEFTNTDIAEKVMVVPASAVGENAEGRVVFLIDGDDKKAMVKTQIITIGNLTPEGFEVKSGLQLGQKVATAGLQTLLDGQEVKIN